MCIKSYQHLPLYASRTGWCHECCDHWDSANDIPSTHSSLLSVFCLYPCWRQNNVYMNIDVGLSFFFKFIIWTVSKLLYKSLQVQNFKPLAILEVKIEQPETSHSPTLTSLGGWLHETGTNSDRYDFRSVSIQILVSVYMRPVWLILGAEPTRMSQTSSAVFPM